MQTTAEIMIIKLGSIGQIREALYFHVQLGAGHSLFTVARLFISYLIMLKHWLKNAALL